MSNPDSVDDLHERKELVPGADNGKSFEAKIKLIRFIARHPLMVIFPTLTVLFMWLYSLSNSPQSPFYVNYHEFASFAALFMLSLFTSAVVTIMIGHIIKSFTFFLPPELQPGADTSLILGKIDQTGMPQISSTPANLDFVASNHVLVEKQGGEWASLVKGRGYTSPLGRICGIWFVTVLVLVTAMFCIMSMNDAGSDFARTASSSVSLFISCLLAAATVSSISTVIFAAVFGSMVRGFPTNIRMDDKALWFAWCFKKSKETIRIPWAAVSKLDIEKGATDKLVVEIDRNQIGPLDGWFFIMHMQALWRKGSPFANKYGKRDRSLIELAFPLDSLTLDSDRDKLIAAVKAHVSPDCLTEKFLELENSNNAPGITRLWLDEMNSFRRERESELPAGATLQLGRYEIVSNLATGGQAKIYSGIATATSIPVALKELILPVHAGMEVRERSVANVKKEAALLSSFSHPAIVKIVDSFVEDHRAYLVLEKIEGVTVRKLVKEGGAMPPAQVLSVAIQIGDVLVYLHGHKPPVVHRDLAPDNLMLDGERIKLIDFNVAQQLESTSTKTVVGKHNYMAPEQFRGQPCEQSDLYSLGATIAFMLTGEDPTPLSSVPVEDCGDPLRRGLLQVAHKLTALELGERYASAKEVQVDLHKLCTAKTI